ncbi:TY-Chap domain-containing protein [Pseudonocardia humida]|uniref:TY-Chap N-terminal domain-containing protein n=1 Tax=Pseudonocardia humida TaxID=2800819 RepID=A0ABT0ZVS9_9PSEU|nr:hypothetical protein [Pseudonocardia humida]MCO1654837.1 hypothetical protein [Pseudonocardia humida]
MADAIAPTWGDDVTDELTARLPRLRDGDAITIDIGPHFVQFKQFGQALSVIASGQDRARPGTSLSPDQARDMVALGWLPSDEMPIHQLDPLPAPMSAETARQVAGLLVASLRDVFGGATPAAATFSSHNDGGHRAPTLSTVAVYPGQLPEVRVAPASLLPPPSPTWRGHLEALLAGVGSWSRAEIDAVLAGRGWEITGERGYTGLAAAGGVEVQVLPAGAGSGSDFRRVVVRERLASAAAATRFREVLAAVVAVLGDPPLVGGPAAFARWRGDPLTVIVSHRPGRDTATVAMTVTPTDVIEAEEYRSSSIDPVQPPDHHWTTWPDTDAPEHRSLHGMMSFPRPPATDLDELGRNLRELFGSFTADLPLLHPYAGGACVRILGPTGEWLADGAFTRDGARLRVGGGNAPSESFPLDGARTGTVIADRVMAALAAAGVEKPGQLRCRVWSTVPAERLEVDPLTSPDR